MTELLNTLGYQLVKNNMQQSKNKRINQLPLCILMTGFLWFLSGCSAVGPDFVKPGVQTPAKWQSELRNGLQSRSSDAKFQAQWWETFGDPVLTNLIREAVTGNLDFKEAGARLWEARARRGSAGADRFPSVTASGSAAKIRSSEAAGNGHELDLYSAGFDANWEIDFFWGVRRSIEQADANLEASQEDMHDVLVSLAAEVALNYIELRSSQTRLAIAKANMEAQNKTVSLVENQFKAGLSAKMDLYQAKYNAANTQAQVFER